MKPSKNQTDQGVKKKELNESKSTPMIKKYFKSIPKPSVNENNGMEFIDGANSKAFYIEALKKKLQEFAEVPVNIGENKETSAIGGDVVEREDDVVLGSQKNGEVSKNASKCSGCTEKDIQYRNLEMKYKELKMVYVKLSLRCSELDLKYNDLRKTKTQTIVLDVNDAVASTNEVFSPNEVKSLQRISLEKKKDSTFILQGLRYAYKNDLSILSSKSRKGKPESMQISDEGEVEWIAGKDPLTPKKVERLKDLFIERICKCEVDPVEYGERITDSNINKLIASGILNISKKQ